MPLQKIDDFFLFSGDFDDSIGNVFFTGGSNPAVFFLAFKDSRPVDRDFVSFDQTRIFIRIDEIVFNFA